ncbi:MAG: glycosyltransferase family 4 protein [Thermodesulfobacteriota bacterium]|nr:glycosyltransferase family 4 protein [Thermodesulfobacteriota bacterium]
MNIVHVLSSFTFGGIERLIVDLAQVNHERRDASFSVIIINHDYRPELVHSIRQLNVNLVLLDRPPGNAGTVPFYALRLRKAIKQLKPDILHVHNRLSFFFTWLAAQGLSAKKIYTLHNTRLYNTGIRDLMIKNLAVKQVDAFIAISHAVKNDFSDNEHFKRKTTIIYNGINLKKFKHAAAFRNPPIRMVCVAKLAHAQKGQDLLIHAISRLKSDGFPIECLFVGEGVSRNLLQQLINDLALEDCVHLLGGSDDVPALLTASHIFVLPSRFEGLGIVIMEAMAAGLPIVASATDGIVELIEDGKTGLLFRPSDVQDLADKIKKLINGGLLRKQLSHNALEKAEGYSIETMYARYLNVYASVCSSQTIANIE